ncbi:MAG: hypothetical protein JSS30_07030 [Verrucomicrobia bacterium]|nr:hypothetical protein [Verrucomicrobiota bacterium]
MISAVDLYQPNGDWREVTVEKLNNRGELCLNRDNGNKQTFHYTLEVSTGDLYGLRGDADPPHIIAGKAFAIFIVTPFYMLGLMSANFLKIIVDVTSIFWKVIPQSISELSSKGIRATLANALMTVIFEIPNEIILDLWRICRSPLYAIGVQVASLYTMLSPYEGRKWIGKIESQWHDGTPYQKSILDTPAENCVDEVLHDGRILFLAVCMQKMGNIHDKVGSLEKYRIV